MAKKEKTVVPEIVDSVEALEAKMKAMREAQKVFATFTQEQVDKIFYEAAMAANKQYPACKDGSRRDAERYC
jgi:acetaldehyde dehydrogenase/alcohol dehydrogenase